MRSSRLSLVTGALLLTALVLTSCATDPGVIVEGYREAYNRCDVDGMMRLIAKDAVFRVSGVFDLQGQVAIREVAGFDTTLHLNMTMRDISDNGDTVSCTLVEINDWLQLTGIDSAVYSARFVVEEGLITAILAEASRQTSEAMATVMGPFMAWAGESEPEELALLIVDGRIAFSADNARRMMRLMRAWRDSAS